MSKQSKEYGQLRRAREAKKAKEGNLCRRCLEVVLLDEKLHCPACLVYMSEKSTRRRKTVISEGTCPHCRKNPRVGEKKHCADCLKKRSGDTRRSHHKNRLMAMRHYSGGEEPFCRCCGEDVLRFLTLDHINDDGAKHRRKLSGRSKGGTGDYSKIRLAGYKAGLQVLCWNCQWGKRLGGGFCPHSDADLRKPAEKLADPPNIVKYRKRHS